MDSHRYHDVSCRNQTSSPPILVPTQIPSIANYQIYTVIAWFAILIYILGFLANCMIVAIIMLTKHLQSASFLLIANFSFTSIVFSFSAACMELSNQILLLILASKSSPVVNPIHANTTAIISNISGRNSSSQYPKRHLFFFPLCEILTGIIFAAITAGIYILMIISIQHYQAIKTNFRHTINIKRILMITISIWLFALSFCLPYSILTVKTSYQMTRGRLCIFDLSNAKRLVIIYTIAYIVFTILLPVAIICFCYSVVILKLCRGIQLLFHITNSWITTTPRPLNQFDRKSKAAMRLLVIISSLYILCVSPFSVGLMVAAIFDMRKRSANPNYFYQPLDYNVTDITPLPPCTSINANSTPTPLGTFLAVALASLSLLFALNPIFYLIFNQELRKQFIKRFVCHFNLLQRKTSVINYKP